MVVGNIIRISRSNAWPSTSIGKLTNINVHLHDGPKLIDNIIVELPDRSEKGDLAASRHIIADAGKITDYDVKKIFQSFEDKKVYQIIKEGAFNFTGIDVLNARYDLPLFDLIKNGQILMKIEPSSNDVLERILKTSFYKPKNLSWDKTRVTIDFESYYARNTHYLCSCYNFSVVDSVLKSPMKDIKVTFWLLGITAD